MRHRFRVGPWEVDPAGNRLEREGRAVHLEPKVMDLLVALACRPGEVVARARLFAEIWPDTFVSDEALTTAVYQLRKALGDRARSPRFVETVPKRGYRLAAPVSPVSAAPPGGLRSSSSGLRWALAASLALTALAWVGPGPAGNPSPAAGGGGGSLVAEARRSLDRWGPEAVAGALEAFEEAVARDPADPVALAGLAESLMRAHSWGLVPRERVEPRARDAAAAAVALAPALADTHRTQALVRLGLDWDFAAAEAGARRALALDPHHARAHALLAQLHFIAGRREEALGAMARARRSAPRSPAVHGLSGTLASVLGLPETAERHYRRVLELDPADSQAVAALAKLDTAAAGGDPEGAPAAREVLDRVAASAARGEVPPWHLASLYAELGEPGLAVEWLERAWSQRDSGVFFLRYDTRWDPYRDHPGVRALLARLSPS